MARVLTIVLLALAAPLAAQVTVHSYVDNTVLGDAETLAYTLELSGDLSDLGPIQPPDARGLALAQATPVLRSRVVTNGQDRLTLRWLYRPLRAGRAELLGTRIPVGGRILETDPISIEVVTQGLRNAPRASRSQPSTGPKPDVPATAEGDLFVRAEPSTRRVVPGQQVVIDYVLYSRPDLQPRRSQVSGTWDAEGFWREELDVPDRDTYPRAVTIGGEEFNAVTLRRMALFGTRTGSLEIGTMTFEIEVARASADRSPFGPLFSPFTSRFSTETVTAPALTLSSSALPSGAPESFSGAVGQFGLAAFMDRDQAAAGDPMLLTVEIRGSGNIATLSAPEVEFPAEFDLFDPQEERQIDRGFEVLSGSKTFTFTVVPRGGGSFVIPPIEWTYFDTDTGRYTTLRSSPFPLEISGAIASASAVPEGTPTDPSVPLGLMAEADWRRVRTLEAPPVSLIFGAFGLPLLALIGLFALRRAKDARADDSAPAVALRAHPEAKRRLKEARSAIGDPAAFYSFADGAIRDFLSDRLGTPARGLPRSTVRHTLAARGVSSATAQLVYELLAECERAQFAPGLASDISAQRDSANRAAQLFAAIDKEALPIPD